MKNGQRFPFIGSNKFPELEIAFRCFLLLLSQNILPLTFNLMSDTCSCCFISPFLEKLNSNKDYSYQNNIHPPISIAIPEMRKTTNKKKIFNLSHRMSRIFMTLLNFIVINIKLKWNFSMLRGRTLLEITQIFLFLDIRISKISFHKMLSISLPRVKFNCSQKQCRSSQHTLSKISPWKSAGLPFHLLRKIINHYATCIAIAST